jgi:hypothetical protein
MVFQFYQKTLNGLKLLFFESQIRNPKSKIVPEQGFRSGTSYACAKRIRKILSVFA